MNTLKCQYEDCGLILEKPVTLLCKKNVCFKHLDGLEIKFKCLCCSKQHSIPENGFSVNESIEKMIENFRYQTDPLRNSIKESLNELNEILFKEYKTVDSFDFGNNNNNLTDTHNENNVFKEIDDKIILILKDDNKDDETCKIVDLKVKSNDFILSSNCGELIREYKGHTKSVKSIQINENSNRLISGSEDKTIKIWNLETGECLKTLKEHHDWVNSILIISNNKFLSGSDDKTIKIWDLDSFECLNTLKNEKGIKSLCSISDNQIACGCYDGSINIWNLNNLTKVKTLKAHDDCIQSLLLVDKTKLISCSSENNIKIWNLVTFECVKILEGHFSHIYQLELILDGILLSCSFDKTVKLWQIETGKEKELKSIRFNYPVYCLKVLNENLLAIGLGNEKIQIYDLKKQRTVKIFSSHSNIINQLNSLSYGYLLSGSDNGEIKLWKIFE